MTSENPEELAIRREEAELARIEPREPERKRRPRRPERPEDWTRRLPTGRVETVLGLEVYRVD